MGENIWNRLFNVARSYAQGTTRILDRLFEDAEQTAKAKISGAHQQQAEARRFGKTNSPGHPSQQVIEDLAVFDLTPPATMEELRRARNREIKKYHPDQFLHDPQKLETAKQIMQIYNAAYARLQAYYRDHL